MNRDRNFWKYSFILMIFGILLFVTESQALTNNGVIIPFIKYKTIIPLLLILLLGTIVILFTVPKIKGFDIVFVILLLRFFLGLIPIIYIDVPSSYFGNLVSAIIPLLVYFVFSNIKIDEDVLNKMFFIVGIIISFQCIWTFLLTIKSYANYNDLYYKNYIVIPIGASNNIAACLLPLLIQGNMTIKKKSFNLFYTALLFLAIIITKSRAVMILTVLFFVYRIFAKRNSKFKLWQILIISIIPISVIIMYIFLPQSVISAIEKIMLGFSSSGKGLDSLMTGRLTVFSNALEQIWKHPIFGNGVSYEMFDNLRTHNAILGVLFEHGFFGLFFFILFLIIFVKKIWRKRKSNKIYFAFSIAIIFILINSMIEEILFSEFIVLFGLSYFSILNNKRGIEYV